MVSLDINKTSAEALQLRVTYLKSCNNIDDASQRALSFMHAGNASWKLPDGVRFTLTSSTETPFTNADSLPTGAPT